VIQGRPKVQKNDLVIRKGKGGRPFVAHSKQLETIRKEITVEAWKQYQEQGGVEPIDYPCTLNFRFYCPRQAEPDLDNLPSIVLDALQGHALEKGRGSAREMQVLLDDKLVREEHNFKIVKGDFNYDGEPRTEFEIRRYNGAGTFTGDVGSEE
jgi:Holliday junction resolvase RusA-like endonuclease